MGEDRSESRAGAQGSSGKKARGRYIRVFVGLRTSKKWRALDSKGGPRLEHYGLLELLSLHSRMFETDGVLSRGDVRRAVDIGDREVERLEELLADLSLCGFIERGAGGVVRIHEWDSHQVSEAKLAAARENGRRGGRPRRGNPIRLPSVSAVGSSSVSTPTPESRGDRSSEDVGKQEARPDLSRRQGLLDPSSRSSGGVAKPNSVSSVGSDSDLQSEENPKEIVLPPPSGGGANGSAKGKRARKPKSDGLLLEERRLAAGRDVQDVFLELWSADSGKPPEDHEWAQRENKLRKDRLGFYIKREGGIEQGRDRFVALIRKAFASRRPEYLFRDATPAFHELCGVLKRIDTQREDGQAHQSEGGTSRLLRIVKEEQRRADES